MGKYFQESEFRCPCCDRVSLNPRLIPTLDAIREIYGKPMVVTSGFRCPEHNEAIGGKNGSEHLIGCAADISCIDSHERFELITACLSSGITRLGIGKDFIHIGISQYHPQRVVWHYYRS